MDDPESENWDDAFELEAGTGSRKERTRVSTASSQITEDWDAESHSRNPSSGPSTPIRRQLLSNSEAENWDDDFEDKTDSPVQKTHRKQPEKPISPSQTKEHENWDEEFEHDGGLHAANFNDADEADDDMDDFNADDREEDQTVTARSRRVALSRLAVYSPPPPVPPLPDDLFLSPHEHEFNLPGPSRSPTASVFSVPASHYSYNSTTHLRPSGRLGNLPASPPIHKERERRRLRKKSKAKRPGAIDGLPSPPPTNGKTPLLTRIGSVKKKWAVRKRDKRASSTPSEVMMQEQEQEGSIVPPKQSTNWFLRATSGGSSSSQDVNESDSQTPKAKPKSKSRYSLAQTEVHPPPLLPPFEPSETAHPETPSKLVKRKSLGFVQLRSRNNPVVPPRNPARKASANAASTSDLPSDLEAELQSVHVPTPSTKQELHAQSRHTSYSAYYGGIGLGRAGDAVRSTDHVDSIDQDDRRSSSRRSLSRTRSRSQSKSRDRDRDRSEVRETRESNKDGREGSRGFMGSVRRISFGGNKEGGKQPQTKHKRTKSGVSLASVTEGIKKSLERKALGKERSDDTVGRISCDDVDIDVDSSHSQPLSPIELSLSPPSPPQTFSHATTSLNSPLSSPLPSSSVLLSKSSSSTVVPSPIRPPALPPHPQIQTQSQTASLGRSTVLIGILASSTSMPQGASIGVGGSASSPFVSSLGQGTVPRRNSLGDLKLGELKIPARISQAQVGLRRDLGMVKEFAGRVEQLKNLQSTYHHLVVEVQGVLDAQHAQHAGHGIRAVSPSSTFSSSPPTHSAAAEEEDLKDEDNGKSGSNDPDSDSYKHLAAAFYTINSKYKIAWECAELLIELGGRPSSSGAGTSINGSNPSLPPPTSTSAPHTLDSQVLDGLSSQSKKSRERAVTLSGEQQSSSKPGTPTPGSYGSSHMSYNYDSSSYGSYGSSYESSYGSNDGGNAAPSKPTLTTTPNLAWRASTGRHDLSQRQLVLLREMLNNSDSSFVTEATSGVYSPSSPSPLGLPFGAQPPQPHPLSAHSQTSALFSSSYHHPYPRPNSALSGLSTSGESPTSNLALTSNEHENETIVNREWRWGGGAMGNGWIGGDGMNSTVTLPSEPSEVSEDSSAYHTGKAGNAGEKRRRSSKLKGMTGLRDMLKSLTRQGNNTVIPTPPTGLPAPSTTSLNTNTDSSSHHRYPHARIGTTTGGTPGIYGRRRSKTSSGPDAGSSIRDRDIFRIGGSKDREKEKEKERGSPSSTYLAAGISTENVAHTRESSGTNGTSDEDWDRLEYPHDSQDSADNGVRGGASPKLLLKSPKSSRSFKNPSNQNQNTSSTIRGRSPYMEQDAQLPPLPPPQRRSPSVGTSGNGSGRNSRAASASASQTSLSLAASPPSIGVPGVPPRATRLSNVEEAENTDREDRVDRGDPRASRTSLASTSGLKRTGSSPVQFKLGAKTGSVRSMPPQLLQQQLQQGNSNYGAGGGGYGGYTKLAMTPENIKPLLENAKEVHTRLTDCIREIRALMGIRSNTSG
ncbi:hypothetical protein BDP27DRAFT_1398518 [Rhodocollybia butyracea]|uniref:Uncharacterized protein n=1 Tax=Rhodocollybia butyracea TaxID=206335 RepID=A0A9P5Q7M4_9AGAR|nr:hypothetical protein BDP27DRAFT_1398518 [Rhodocollybia butyracea]